MTKQLVARLRTLSLTAPLLSLILTLNGCTTGPLSQGSVTENHLASATRYLQMAEDPSSPNAFEYHLRAADQYLKANQVAEASRVLRNLQGKDLNIDLTARNQIVEARLSLLKQDTHRAQTLLHTLLAPYANRVETPMPVEAARPQEHKKIALLLPSKGPHADAAKTIREGFLTAHYKNAKQDALDPSIKVYDTGEGVVEAYQKALAEGVDFIVGPLTKSEVQTLSNIKLEVPVLALNTLQSSRATTTDKLYQFGLMPEDELAAIADKAAREGHQRSIILGPQNEWGQRMMKTFATLWKNHGGQSITIPLNNRESLDNQLQAVLKQAKDSDMVFLAAPPELARQIKPLLNFYQHKLPVYATASIYSGNPSPKLDHDLDGIRFCDIPWVITREAHSPSRAPRYFALGMDAYSLASQLAQSRSLPSAGISGTTGILRLDGHRIQRQLIGAKFEQGLPVPD